MSQYPPAPPFPPQGPPFQPYGPYGALQPEPKPLAITAPAVTGIVLASLFLLCNCLGLFGSIFVMAMGGKNPVMPNAPVMSDPVANGVGAADSGVKLVLSAVLLAGSIGALRLSPWARKTLVIWSVLTLIWATAALALEIVYVLPAALEMARRAQPNGVAPPANMVSIMKATQIGQYVIAWLFWCVLPAVFLILWRSPKVVAAFGLPAAPAEQTWPPSGA